MRFSTILPFALISAVLAADPAVDLVNDVVAKLKAMDGHIAQITPDATKEVAEHCIMGSKDLMAALQAGASKGASVAAATDAAAAKSALSALSSGAKTPSDAVASKKDMAAKAGVAAPIKAGLVGLKGATGSFFDSVGPKLAVAGGDVASSKSATLAAIDGAIGAF